MLDIRQSNANQAGPTPVIPVSAIGAIPQTSAVGTQPANQAESGSSLTQALTTSLKTHTNLDLGGLSVPKIGGSLSTTSKTDAASNIVVIESPDRSQVATARIDFLRENFPFGKSTYDLYFSAGGGFRDVFETLTYGASWMSGLGVAGAAIAHFGLSPLPFLGAVAAGLSAWQAILFCSDRVAGAIWGE